MFETVTRLLRGRKAVDSALPETPAISDQVVHNADSGMSFSELAEVLGINTGETTQPVSPQAAMKVSAVYACVRLIAGAKASLPIDFYEQVEGTRELIDQHPLWRLLSIEPTPICSAAVFWEYIECSRQLYGDGFALVVRDNNGNAKELIPLHPLMVMVERRNNRLLYYVQIGDQYRGVDQDDMLHFCNFGFDGLRSMSTIRWGARSAIGIAQAAEQHSSGYYKNATTSRVALTYPQRMDGEQIDKLREQWVERYGGVGNAHKPLILTQGGTVATLSVSAADAQLLEARQYEVIDIARAFGVPPFMIGATEKTSAWGSGVAEMGQGFINYTMQPHLVRDEQELNRKLFRSGQFYVEYDRSALLRSDPEKLGKYYREAIGGSQGPGWLLINEIRRWEKLPPIEGGDKLFFPSKGTDNAPKPTRQPDPRQPGQTSQHEGSGP